LSVIRPFCTIAAALIVALTFSTAGATERPVTNIPKKLDERTAQTLASLAFGLGTEARDYDPDNPEIAPPFFVLHGLAPSPRQGSFGFFAVNPWTGDVWALWGCWKITSPAARKMQGEIRKRFTSQELKQYPRLRRLKPECLDEWPRK
jgi:hypothetical protein